MDRQRISRIAHTRHPVAAPLADESVARLLERATAGAGQGRLLDLGCGEGAWLVRALAANPLWRAVGVDVDVEALVLARERATALGVVHRIGLHHQDAREFGSHEPFDVVLCVGSTHALGGLAPTLAAARELLAPGGRLVLGEGFWEHEPPRAALEALGAAREEYASLAATTDRLAAEGWTPVDGHVSTQQEWDAYEFAWTGSLAEWALDHPDDPEAAAAREAADSHRRAWLHGYRGVLGFVTYVLRRD
ncbi:SAM-dependent methyltransferase [Kitasatospora sp. NPDC101183]|uniref:SAM-dependent methyltransferase n=1 Tax=Kitasatospora sp. NPDC101183 TaxID=3364100 RepID=UPI003808B71F